MNLQRFTNVSRCPTGLSYGLKCMITSSIRAPTLRQHCKESFKKEPLGLSI